MFTQMDKALAALIGAVVFMLQTYFKIDLSWVTAETIQTFIPYITALFVYMVPNKPASTG